MTKLSNINIKEIFRLDALKLIESRTRSKLIHKTSDIKSAGNEIEEEVRKFIRSRMPSNFYVGHGHIVDCEQKTSPQFDILISDNTRIPILLRANDSTEYFPFESVYSIGEVKSSYNKSEKPIEKFCESIMLIKQEMKREIFHNTFHDGKLKDDTLMSDVILGKRIKVFNALYSFMIFINSDTFDIKEFENCKKKFDKAYLPNQIFFLDRGVVFYGRIENGGLTIEKYPEYDDNPSNNWFLTPFGQDEVDEGAQLGMFYYNLLDHLNSCFLKPLNLLPYYKDLLTIRKSKTIQFKNEI